MKKNKIILGLPVLAMLLVMGSCASINDAVDTMIVSGMGGEPWGKFPKDQRVVLKYDDLITVTHINGDYRKAKIAIAGNDMSPYPGKGTNLKPRISAKMPAGEHTLTVEFKLADTATRTKKKPGLLDRYEVIRDFKKPYVVGTWDELNVLQMQEAGGGAKGMLAATGSGGTTITKEIKYQFLPGRTYQITQLFDYETYDKLVAAFEAEDDRREEAAQSTAKATQSSAAIEAVVKWRMEERAKIGKKLADGELHKILIVDITKKK